MNKWISVVSVIFCLSGSVQSEPLCDNPIVTVLQNSSVVTLHITIEQCHSTGVLSAKSYSVTKPTLDFSSGNGQTLKPGVISFEGLYLAFAHSTPGQARGQATFNIGSSALSLSPGVYEVKIDGKVKSTFNVR